ncbi:uncharacterized protein LOC121676217 [Corvus kubaryi]|uniref:uncharacterized protein LOC121676217 n=1 Tax=Corvus kubaryi TaxID=68294 RepID=UPI001C0585AC|nr:uncharacterized protein LOC121676217 [Corvus kubaryi]
MRTWRAGGRAHARRSAGTPRTPRTHTPRILSPHTPRPRPAPRAPRPGPAGNLPPPLARLLLLLLLLLLLPRVRCRPRVPSAGRTPRSRRAETGAAGAGGSGGAATSPGSPTASLRPSPRCCFVISCPSCDTRRPLYGNLKGTFTSAAAGPAGTPGGLRAPPVPACLPSAPSLPSPGGCAFASYRPLLKASCCACFFFHYYYYYYYYYLLFIRVALVFGFGFFFPFSPSLSAEGNNRGITGRAGTVREDGPRSWRLRDPVLVCGRGGSRVLEAAEKTKKNPKQPKEKKKRKTGGKSLFVSD